MKIRSTVLIFFVLTGSLILSACSGGGTTSTSWPGVSLGQENAYLAYKGDVLSLRLSDGGLVWRYPEKSDLKRGFYAAPELDGDQLLVGDFAGNLTSLDASTGSTRWTYTPGNGRWVASPLAVGGTILAPSSHRTVYALTRAGKPLWEFPGNNSFWAKPTVMGEMVYVTSLDHFLYAMKLSDGKKVWETDLGGSAIASAALDEQEKTLYLGTLANELLAVNAETGKVVWRFAAQGGIWNKPLIVDGSVYFGDLKGVVYALDKMTGKQMWTLDAGGPVIASGTLTPEGIVFCTENGNVFMTTPGGTKAWTRTITGKLYSAPEVASDRMVIGVMDGDVLMAAMDFKGNDLWSYTPSK